MGKDYYGYVGGNKAAGKGTGGGSSKGNGGGSGKPVGGGAAGSGPRGGAGGRDYYGVNKASTGYISKAYHKHTEKNTGGNKEAARRFERSPGSYKVINLNDPPRRPVYDIHPRAAAKPKEKLPLPPPSPPKGGFEYFPTGGPWQRPDDKGEEDASDAEKDYGETDDDSGSDFVVDYGPDADYGETDDDGGDDD